MTTLTKDQLRKIYLKASDPKTPGIGNDKDITEPDLGPYVTIKESDLRQIIPEIPDPKKSYKNQDKYNNKVSEIFGGWASKGGMLRSLGAEPLHFRVELDEKKLKEALKIS